MLKYEKLSQSVRYVLNEAGYSGEAITQMSCNDAFDAFLKKQGLIGYTLIITNAIDSIRAAHMENENDRKD